MTILIIGRGLLAQEVAFAARARGAAVWMRSRRDGVDVRDSRSMAEMAKSLRACPSAIFNCAAYTSVDGAESNPAEAHAVNAIGAENVAHIARRLATALVHFSTDSVFGHVQKRPTELVEPVDPPTVYGMSKLIGEHLVRRTTPGAMILRVANLYGDMGTNWGSKLRGALEAGQEVQGDISRRVSPTWARWAAETSLQLLDFGGVYPMCGGVYHLCAAKHAMWAEFGESMAEQLKCDPALVKRVYLTRRASQAQVGLLSSVLLPLRGIDVPSWSDLLLRYLKEERTTCTES